MDSPSAPVLDVPALRTLRPPLQQARHDPAHCLAPGLFQSLARGDRKGRNLDITYHYNDNISVRFTGYNPLGAEELRLLQGLLAMAAQSKTAVDLNNPISDPAKQLVSLIKPEDDALLYTAATIKTTIHRLMGEVGYKTDGGQTRKDVIESLTRLAGVAIHAHAAADKRRVSSQLLSFYLDEKTGELRVALNPRLTQAIIGGDGNSYTLIDMREVRVLRGDVARLLHQRLSAIVQAGRGSKRFKLNTMLSYVWPGTAEGSTLRRRRQLLRQAFKELEATGGWLIKEEAEGLCVVTRRPIGYTMALPRPEPV